MLEVAALTVLAQSQEQLTFQQHLEIAPDSLNLSEEELEGELHPLVMAAQAVPNSPAAPSDKKRYEHLQLRSVDMLTVSRVKVYELRDNDWFDRGTGFCTAEFIFVCYFR